MTQLLAGRYELGAELGAGGMARVREAYDRTLARRVAVKLLHSHTMAQPGMRDRFLREARAAASFQHPNAVAIYDTGRDDGVPYMVMELVEGRTLAEVLEARGALRHDEAVAVASQVLSALGDAHRRGLVHRDVKPANVLLPGGELPRHPNGDPPAKLADFGIAKGLEEAAGGLTATGQVLGTPKYVSPEQVAGQPATPRSDVYSLGVMLYEMLAGHPPFEADTAIGLALAHRDDPVPRLERRVPGLDRGLAAVVHKALEKNPQHRFTDAAEMRAALASPGGLPPAAAATAPLDEQARGTTAVLDEPRRRTPWGPVALIAMLALALLAIIAVDWDGLMERFGPAPLEPAEETEDGADEGAPTDDDGGDGGDGGEGSGDEEPTDGDGEGDAEGEGDADGDGETGDEGDGGDAGDGEGDGGGGDPDPPSGADPPPADEEPPPGEDLPPEETDPPPDDEGADSEDDANPTDGGDESGEGGDGSVDGQVDGDSGAGEGQADGEQDSSRRGAGGRRSTEPTDAAPDGGADPADADEEQDSRGEPPARAAPILV